jgi:hypothetical protein
VYSIGFQNVALCKTKQRHNIESLINCFSALGYSVLTAVLMIHTEDALYKVLLVFSEYFIPWENMASNIFMSAELHVRMDFKKLDIFPIWISKMM